MILQTPRYTTFWQHQAELAKKALADAYSNPDLAHIWRETRCFLKKSHTIDHMGNTRDEKTLRQFIELQVRLLIVAIKIHAPLLTHVFGEFLEEWAMYLLVADVSRGQVWRGMPRRIERFLPDNSITRDPDGRFNIPDCVGPDHLKQLSNYIESLKAASQPGRPHGSGYFRDSAEFYTVVTGLIKMAQAKGLPPTQTTIAMLMGQSPRLPTTNDRALRRYCARYGYRWENIVKAALMPIGQT